MARSFFSSLTSHYTQYRAKMTPSPTPAFVPKQALAILANSVDVYEKTGGKVTAQFALEAVRLVSPIPDASVIHDNACGPGTITRTIMKNSRAIFAISGIKIVATDSNPAFLAHLRATVIASQEPLKDPWPVEVLDMRSEALNIPDLYFSHSFTNIALFMMSNSGLDGATEIYRTLKPGGIAVVNCWQSFTWLDPIRQVHAATRSPGRAFRAPPVSWADGTQLKKVMLEAGFREEDIKMSTSEATAVAVDLRAWAELSWAYLGGLQGWAQEDEDRWDEAVDLLTEKLREADGTRVAEDGVVRMRASQHILVAKKQ